MRVRFGLVLACVVATAVVDGGDGPPSEFRTGGGAMAGVAVTVVDSCHAGAATRVSAVAVWVDGRYDHELLLFPGSGRDRYDTLLGPLPAGRHRVQLRPSAFWEASRCIRIGSVTLAVVESGRPRHDVLRRAPVLELRADTVGEQTDLPLFEYVEDLARGAVRTLRYTVVFSNEDGGTETRALLSRWGRTTDIEQVYEVSLRDGKAVREEFQGPDHETREFKGRRRGAAPVLLVATLNNMVTDRGRGIAAIRPVPEGVDLANATRESTMDARPWAYRAMQAEMVAEGRIAPVAPGDERWLRVAPDPREHLYVEARLALDHAVAAAWARDSDGRRYWSHYERESLAIDRNGWVRTAIAVGPGPASRVVETGWACLRPAKETAPGGCVIDATRAFGLGENWMPGPNRITPMTIDLRAGEEAAAPARRPAPRGSR